jgi:hypothetical protein
MPTPDPTLTFWLAVYGAGLSTLTLIWNLVRDVLDRRQRVRVTVAIVRLFGPGVHDPNEYLKIGLTNVSRQADVVINQVGVFYGRFERWSRFKKRTHWGIMLTRPGDLPRRLTPDEHVDLLLPVPTGETLERVLDARRFYVTDSRGRRHAVARRELVEFQHNLLKRQVAALTTS